MGSRGRTADYRRSVVQMDQTSTSCSSDERKGDRKVLVVEDDQLYQSLLLNLLQRESIDCLPAVSSGPEAIAVAGQMNPAVVLLDIDLDTTMNGVEVARQIAGMSSTLVIFLSGHANDHVMDEAKATFPFAYLTKPADPRQLSALIFGAFRYRECLRAEVNKGAPLTEFITICAWCRKIKSPDGWIPLAEFVMQGRVKRITHGVCQPCMMAMLEKDGLA